MLCRSTRRRQLIRESPVYEEIQIHFRNVEVGGSSPLTSTTFPQLKTYLRQLPDRLLSPRALHGRERACWNWIAVHMEIRVENDPIANVLITKSSLHPFSQRVRLPRARYHEPRCSVTRLITGRQSTSRSAKAT